MPAHGPASGRPLSPPTILGVPSMHQLGRKCQLTTFGCALNEITVEFVIAFFHIPEHDRNKLEFQTYCAFNAPTWQQMSTTQVWVCVQ